MPFTLAHPAVVMPLRKSSFLSTTGLVIGSMVPDMEFYIKAGAVEKFGHQWAGVFLLDLPLALFLAFLFHNVLRNVLLENLPSMYRKRFLHLRDFNWNEYALKNKGKVILSILIGTTTHLLWDGFTHHNGIFVELIPFLASSISIMGEATPVYYLLQVVFSLLGLIMVHFQLMKFPIVQKEVEDTIDYKYWMVFTLVFFAALSFRLIIGADADNFGGMAVAITGSFFYSWVPVSLLFNYKLQLRRILV